jgi:hypothetical protein
VVFSWELGAGSDRVRAYLWFLAVRRERGTGRNEKPHRDGEAFFFFDS